MGSKPGSGGSAAGTASRKGEDLLEIVRRTSRNVKRWQSGDMCLRWTAAGMLEADRQFRRIIGYRGLAKLALAIGRDLSCHQHQEVLITTG